MAIRTLHNSFPKEGEIIGRLLTEYTNLELQAVLNMVAVGPYSFDEIIKKIFQRMGESKRLKEIRKMGQQGYTPLLLTAEFDEAIDNIDYCREIRNQYAHSVFWDDWGDTYGFGNMEDIAQQTAKLKDFSTLPRNSIDLATLHLQETYFEYTDLYFIWLVHDAQKRLNKPHLNRAKPPKLTKPPLCKP